MRSIVQLYNSLYARFFRKEPEMWNNLFATIDLVKPQNILEIGTWNGDHALRMIATAQRYHPVIHYYGVDLFEDMDPATFQQEFSKGGKNTMAEIQKKLEKTGAVITLYKGNTKALLPQLDLSPMDFIFIDGGESPETIINDWNCAKKLMHAHTKVIFSCYTNIENFGCNKIVDNLDRKEYMVEILEPQTTYQKSYGLLKINFVRVGKAL